MLPPRGPRTSSLQAHERSPHRTAEVSRLEFENLYTEIEGLLKAIRRVESDVRRLGDRVHRLERRQDRSDK